MHPLETYLKSLHDIHLSGQAVGETSYYGPIAELLNELGKTLDPKVSCVINLQNKGAGIPDGGLFTADQFKAQRRKKVAKGEDGPPPARGVLEIKGTDADVMKTAASVQVAKYLKRYGQVLVTNYRDFVLVTRGSDGEPRIGERHILASSDRSFWKAAGHPQAAAAQHGVRFAEYVKRVMLHRAQIDDPKDLAWFLASYARDALARIEADAEQPSLATIRKALEQALGINFSGEKGEHFFRSTLVQTLFYGLFSAWVLWSRQHQHSDRKARFHWKEAAWTLHVPAIKVLFEQLATPTRLGQLDLVEVLEWSEAALNRVDRAAFFRTFEQAQAVQYFYEPFLEAFDPELRKELGVWYTPHEVVQYMVARVETVLREELNLADGLADPRVIVLDPCCGTGAYLVEVLRRIGETLKEKGGDALLGHDLKHAAMERIFGFELLPAPFVVSHLQLNLLLQQAGAPIDAESKERVGVYLTNALTGWQPPTEEKQHLIWDELEAERDAAEQVKREQKILVILGNPPYNAFAGISPEEEEGLVEPYKQGLTETWKIKKYNLDDLYVRFLRLAERKIVEGTGRGVVCYISNFSYLTEPSYVVMRKRLQEGFDKIWIDCMNGDSRETGKLTPDGLPDPSVFSTESNREGIRVGTAIGLFVRTHKSLPDVVRHCAFRDFWGDSKRQDLLFALEGGDKRFSYIQAFPVAETRFSFQPMKVAGSYLRWPRLSDMGSRLPMNGLMEKRGGSLIDFDRNTLVERMERYLNAALSWQDAKDGSGLYEDAARFDAEDARKRILEREAFDKARVVKYAVRPFDTRWAYYTGVRPIWNEPRPSLWSSLGSGNRFILSRPAGVTSPEGGVVAYTKCLGDNDYVRGHAYYFPFEVAYEDLTEGHQAGLGLDRPRRRPNTSEGIATYLKQLGSDPTKLAPADRVWHHALAVTTSGNYLTENADGLKVDWPRIPLPKNAELLSASASLGCKLASLFDTEGSAPGVNQGTIRAELKLIGPISRQDGKSINTKAGDLEITAGWGHAGKGGITMPGRGKLMERQYTKEERATLDKAQVGKKAWPALLGETTCDVFLNDTACWTNIPIWVWEYTLGGYQVIKKWLSYREHALLGRALSVEEARYVTEMARRISAILLLGPALDENYEAVKRETWAWPSSQAR